MLNLFLLLFRFLVFRLCSRTGALSKAALLFAENAVLRRILQQHGIPLSFLPHEKQFVHEFARRTKNPGRFFSLVSPAAILRSWKHAFSNHWNYAHRKRKPGRPPVTKAVKELILKLKQENYRWGLRRIRDELKKLSIDVSHETIAKVLGGFRKTGDLKPNLSWKRFLSAHWNSLFAGDFFTATIFGFTTLYVFFILELKTRKIVQYGITANPTIQYLRNQFSEFEYKYPDSSLIHDNSGELKWFPYDQYSFKSVATSPYSPNMNAYAERFVRSIRQECLDHFVIFTETQLRRVVGSYVDYYNNYRPHQGLCGIPNAPPEQPKSGTIRKKPLVFGLHNHYYREAA